MAVSEFLMKRINLINYKIVYLWLEDRVESLLKSYLSSSQVSQIHNHE